MNICKILESNILGIYIDKSDSSRLLVGQVLSWDNSSILFLMISSDGKEDGKVILNIDFPYRIESNTNYLNQFVQDHIGQPNVFTDYLFDLFINYSIDCRKLLKFKNYNNRTIMYGIILSYTKNRIVVQRYSKKGRKCNLYSIKKSKISFIEFDSLEELNIEKLMNLEKNI